jgi:steroid delta-isomerase-like uncharacterized protein
MPELTRDDLQAIVERHLATWQRHDIAALVGFHSADGIVESPMYGTRRGRTEIGEAYRAFFKSFPDARMDREAILIDPPHVAISITVGATHSDEFFGLPGTSKHIDIRSARFMQFDAAGAIVHERRIYDFTGVLLQLGVLRAKPARP